jgi:DHA1 family multidrug resistance protein-like MFS transporter
VAPAVAPETVDWRRTLRLMWGVQLLAVSGMGFILPFLPLLVRSLGVSDPASVQRWSGAIFSGPFLFAALMTPVWGWIGDRFGRKLMVARALFGLSFALFLMSFARSPVQLLALRILQGMVSGFIPAAIALVSATAPREQQGYALGTLASAQAAGVVLGPLLGGFLADVLGYRPLFYVTAVMELCAALVVLRWVREPSQRAGQGRSRSLRRNLRFALRPPVPVALLGLLVTQLSLLIVQPFFALFVESLGVPAGRLSTTTGVLFGVTGAAMMLASPSWGRLSDRFGRRRTLVVAFTGGAVIFVLQAMAHSVGTLFVWRLLQGLLAAAMLPALYAVIAHASPQNRRAGMMAFGSSATLLGGMLGPLCGGALAARFGMRAVFLLAALLLGLNALNALRLPLDRGPRPPRARRSWELPSQ